MAKGGRINNDLAGQEITRLSKLWGNRQEAEQPRLVGVLPETQLAELDLFDRIQLDAVLSVCRESVNLSEAGRRLFAVSRSQRGSTNDADRLRKYLAKFGLVWADLPR